MTELQHGKIRSSPCIEGECCTPYTTLWWLTFKFEVVLETLRRRCTYPPLMTIDCFDDIRAIVTVCIEPSRSGTGRVVPRNMSSSASKSGAGDDLGLTNRVIRRKWTVTSAGSFGFDTR